MFFKVQWKSASRGPIHIKIDYEKQTLIKIGGQFTVFLKQVQNFIKFDVFHIY